MLHPSLTTQQIKTLIEAINTGNQDGVLACLPDFKANPGPVKDFEFIKDENGTPLLILAIQKIKDFPTLRKVISALLKAGASITQVDKNNNTVFMTLASVAAASGADVNIGLMEALYSFRFYEETETGNATTQRYNTLDNSPQKKQPTQQLNVANKQQALTVLNQTNNKNETLFIQVIRQDQTHVLNWLKGKFTNIEVVDSSGKTGLHYVNYKNDELFQVVKSFYQDTLTAEKFNRLFVLDENIFRHAIEQEQYGFAISLISLHFPILSPQLIENAFQLAIYKKIESSIKSNDYIFLESFILHIEQLLELTQKYYDELNTQILKNEDHLNAQKTKPQYGNETLISKREGALSTINFLNYHKKYIITFLRNAMFNPEHWKNPNIIQNLKSTILNPQITRLPAFVLRNAVTHGYGYLLHEWLNTHPNNTEGKILRVDKILREMVNTKCIPNPYHYANNDDLDPRCVLLYHKLKSSPWPNLNLFKMLDNVSSIVKVLPTPEKMQQFLTQLTALDALDATNEQENALSYYLKLNTNTLAAGLAALQTQQTATTATSVSNALIVNSPIFSAGNNAPLPEQPAFNTFPNALSYQLYYQHISQSEKLQDPNSWKDYQRIMHLKNTIIYQCQFDFNQNNSNIPMVVLAANQGYGLLLFELLNQVSLENVMNTIEQKMAAREIMYGSQTFAQELDPKCVILFYKLKCMNNTLQTDAIIQSIQACFGQEIKIPLPSQMKEFLKQLEQHSIICEKYNVINQYVLMTDDVVKKQAISCSF